jgi:hypothetical protein
MAFYGRNQEALAQERANIEKQKQEATTFAPMLYLLGGVTTVRVLPAYSEKGVFFTTVAKHYIRTPAGGRTFACTGEDSCRICLLGQGYMESGDEAKMKIVRENLRPRTYYLYNTLVLSAPPPKKGEPATFGTVYVMEAPQSVHNQIIGLDQDTAMGWDDITDFEKGVTIYIKRTGTTKNDTKYEVHPHGSGRSNILEQLAAAGVDPSKLDAHDLDKVYGQPDADRLNEALAAIEVQAGGVAASAPKFHPAAPQTPPSVPAQAAPAPAQAPAASPPKFSPPKVNIPALPKS